MVVVVGLFGLGEDVKCTILCIILCYAQYLTIFFSYMVMFTKYYIDVNVSAGLRALHEEQRPL